MPNEFSNTPQESQHAITNETAAQQDLQELPVNLIKAEPPYQKCATFGFDARARLQGTLCAGESGNGVACKLTFQIADKTVVNNTLKLDEDHSAIEFRTLYEIWSGILTVSVKNLTNYRCLGVAWSGEANVPTEQPLHIDWHKQLFCLPSS